MLCDICRAIDFLPLDEYKHKAQIIKDRSNEAFLFTPPNFCDDPEIQDWRNGEGTIHGYYFHHDSGNDLLDSARNGCYLCAVMTFALFDTSTTVSESQLSLPIISKRGYPVILTTVLYPDHRHWREEPRCNLIRTYCGTHESRLDVISIDKGNALGTTYQKLCHELELAWEQNDIGPYLSTWSQLNLQLAIDWYRNCLSTHQACRVGKPLLPKRVIDVGAPTANTQPVLIQPSEPSHAEYITLSHCWGDGTPLVPTEITGSEGVWSLPPLSAWEQTFQDAVAVVKALNVRYLWIDAPCILQGLANRLDWETESVKMAHYYQNATLCICATKAKTSSDGLFSIRNPLLTYPCRILLPAENGVPAFERYLCAGREELLFYWDDEGSPHKSPIHSRAWCLQEELLSPRMLRFGHKRLYWQCLSTSHSESFVGDLPNTVTRPGADSKDDTDVKMHMDLPIYTSEWGGSRNPYYDAWYHTLHRFNLRNISYQNDILPAISGVAESFHLHLDHDEYLAGLWRGDLNVGLLWSTADFDPVRPQFGTTQQNFDKSSLYAPSWSWIIMAHKSLLFGSYKRLETSAIQTNVAHLQSAEISLRDKASPFGLIESGILVFLSQLPRITIMPGVKQTPIFHEEFYFAETSTRRDPQPRPIHRMQMCDTDWELQSKLRPRSPMSEYQLIGQCDLDENPPRPKQSAQGSPGITISAFFLPLKTDRAEFGRIRTAGLLLVRSPISPKLPRDQYFTRIGCGKFDIGPAAWKACKLPMEEVRLI